jgi:hypothetical protein
MQWRKETQTQEVPPGYDPAVPTKPKTKSVKRNERKKDKRLQVCSSLPFIFDLLVRNLCVRASFNFPCGFRRRNL